MKIFISWSGSASRLVAEALSDWLQRVIQAVRPFYSPDIDKGAKWSNEIDDALEGTRFGIICLTPDNLESTWIHYEAGALSKAKDASIWTFLLELKPSDVKQPLGRFQHTLAEKSDMLKMLKSINAKLVETGGQSLREGLLEEIFEESWSRLESRLNEAKELIKTVSKIKASDSPESGRNESDKLDEILEILRSQQRKPDIRTVKPERSKSNDVDYTTVEAAVLYFPDEKSASTAREFLRTYIFGNGMDSEAIYTNRGAELFIKFTETIPKVKFEDTISALKRLYGLVEYELTENF
ncbi:MAG: toll/interleukin-1 receptor domain-containing protein [Acidobacteriota bacterium]|nr:toll/interleukin-1 receptor domain-containing protein [Acidobacteriota bacterium]